MSETCTGQLGHLRVPARTASRRPLRTGAITKARKPSWTSVRRSS